MREDTKGRLPLHGFHDAVVPSTRDPRSRQYQVHVPKSEGYETSTKKVARGREHSLPK